MRTLFRLCLLLVGAGAFGAQLTFTNLAQLRASPVSAASPPLNTSISLLGREVAGDGGGGEFAARRGMDTTTADFIAGTNQHGIYITMPAGAVFERVVKSPVDARWFGAKAHTSGSWTNSVDGPANKIAIQAAIDYARSTPSVGRVVLDGFFITDGPILVPTVTLEGQAVLDFSTGQPSELRLRHGDTNDLVHLVDDGTGFAKGIIRNLKMSVSAEAGRKAPKTITSVASRKVFSVAVGDVPPTPTTPSAWPYYGWCFFYTDEGKWLGAGIVTNVNAGTGQITLADGTDKFATVTGDGGLLRAGFQVCWSQLALDGLGSMSPDPTLAGPVGIRVIGRGYARVENVQIHRAHTGIAIGPLNSGFQPLNVSLDNNHFAGLANSFANNNSDTWASRLKINGVYNQDWATSDTSYALDDDELRKGQAGYYLPNGGSTTVDLLVHSHLVGIYGGTCLHSQFGLVHLDDVLDGIVWRDGAFTRLPGVVQFGQIQIRPSWFPDPIPALQFYTNTTAAIRLEGLTAVRMNIGQLAVETFSFGPTNQFDYLLDATRHTNQWVSIGMLGNISGSRNDRPAGKLKPSRTVRLTGSADVQSPNYSLLTVSQSGAAGYAGRELEIAELATGSGVGRYDQFTLNDVRRYLHTVDGQVIHTAPTGGLKQYKLETDSTSETFIHFNWGEATDARLALGGTSIRSLVNSTELPRALAINPTGGDVTIGTLGATGVLSVNQRLALLNDWTYDAAPVWTTSATNQVSGLRFNITNQTTLLYRFQGDSVTRLSIGAVTNQTDRLPLQVWYGGSNALVDIKVSGDDSRVLYLGPSYSAGGGGSTEQLFVNGIEKASPWRWTNHTTATATATISTNANGEIRVAVDVLGGGGVGTNDCFLVQNNTIVTNRGGDGLLEHAQFIIPANTLSADGDEFELFVPGFFVADADGTTNGIGALLTWDEGMVNLANIADNALEVLEPTSSTRVMNVSSRIKRTSTNTLQTTTRLTVGTTFSVTENPNVIDVIVGLDIVTGIDWAGANTFTLALTHDGTPSTNHVFKTYGYTVELIGCGGGGGTGLITAVSADHEVVAGTLSITNTVGTGKLVRESAAGGGAFDESGSYTNLSGAWDFSSATSVILPGGTVSNIVYAGTNGAVVTDSTGASAAIAGAAGEVLTAQASGPPIFAAAAGGSWDGSLVSTGAIGRLTVGTGTLPTNLTSIIASVLLGKPMVNPANGDLFNELIGGSSALAFAPLLPVAINGGGTGTAAPEGDHGSVFTIDASSTVSNRGVAYFSRSDSEYITQGKGFALWFNVLATNSTVLRAGYGDSITVNDHVDGAFIEINNGYVLGRCINNSSGSDTITSNLVAESTWYSGWMHADTTNSVRFILLAEDGSTVWTDTVTSNIPNTPARASGVVISGFRTSEAAPTSRVALDAYMIFNTKAKVR